MFKKNNLVASILIILGGATLSVNAMETKKSDAEIIRQLSAGVPDYEESGPIPKDFGKIIDAYNHLRTKEGQDLVKQVAQQQYGPLAPVMKPIVGFTTELQLMAPMLYFATEIARAQEYSDKAVKIMRENNTALQLSSEDLANKIVKILRSKLTESSFFRNLTEYHSAALASNDGDIQNWLKTNSSKDNLNNIISDNPYKLTPLLLLMYLGRDSLVNYYNEHNITTPELTYFEKSLLALAQETRKEQKKYIPSAPMQIRIKSSPERHRETIASLIKNINADPEFRKRIEQEAKDLYSWLTTEGTKYA